MRTAKARKGPTFVGLGVGPQRPDLLVHLWQDVQEFSRKKISRSVRDDGELSGVEANWQEIASGNQ